jgi:hypothetical protein
MRGTVGRRINASAALVTLLFCALIFRTGNVTAQSGPGIVGYLEHQFSTSNSDDGWRQIDYDRLRVDLDSRAGRGVRLSAAFVWQLYRGNTRIRLQDVLPDALEDLAGATSVALENRQFLNNAYLSIPVGPLEVTAGKQYLAWGAAMAFNPTELFRPKDLFEPGYEREGTGAITARLALGALSDLLVGYVPEGGFAESGKVIRARHHLAGFDFSVMAAEIHRQPTPSGFGIPAGPLSRRTTLGGDLSGELLGIGIWAESAWSNFAGEQWMEATLGGNYTFADGTLIALEGYFDDRGKWTEPYPTGLWLDRFLGGRRNLGKGMLYGTVSREIGQRWHVGVSGLGNTGDRSFVLIPVAAYSFAEDVDLLFNGLFPFGGEDTEFGTGRLGGFLRARVYF